MTLLHHISLVFLICLLSNALTTTISTHNLTSPTADCDYRCIPKPSVFAKIPKFTDCINAIVRLPRIDGLGSFHNGLPDDPYKLPVEETDNTCTVSVEMVHQGSTREAWSWFLLVQATARLSRECLSPWLSPEQGAGVWIWFGKHGRILVTVRSHQTVNDGASVEVA